MQLSGLLTTFPPADLLQWAHNDQVTGTLVLRRSSREKRVLFRRGKVVGCLSNERFDFYGQHLLAHGYISEPELLVALSECEERGGLRLGQALLRLELLDEETVMETLAEQTRQAVIDLFLWPVPATDGGIAAILQPRLSASSHMPRHRPHSPDAGSVSLAHSPPIADCSSFRLPP
jgi:hypothetical protein